MSARLAGVVFLVALFLPSAAGADNPTLEGFVGAEDSFSIRLQDANGALVKHVDAGTYTIKVHDLSEIHNFHLTGPGVNKSTGVRFRGKATWRLKVTPGRYVYRSDKHKKLRGSFIVSSSGYPA